MIGRLPMRVSFSDSSDFSNIQDTDRSDEASVSFFETKDNKKYPRNSQYPIVIKVASSKELSGLYDAVEKANITHHGFIKEMIETTNDKKIETILAEKTDDDIVLYGVGVFGNDKEVTVLTDHYELWSGNSTA